MCGCGNYDRLLTRSSTRQCAMSARGLGVSARGLRALVVDLELDGDAANCVQLRAWMTAESDGEG